MEGIEAHQDGEVFIIQNTGEGMLGVHNISLVLTNLEDFETEYTFTIEFRLKKIFVFQILDKEVPKFSLYDEDDKQE